MPVQTIPDFLSPSVYNSLKYEGKRIRGKQMVDAMNAAGFNMAVFGSCTIPPIIECLQEIGFVCVQPGEFIQEYHSGLDGW